MKTSVRIAVITAALLVFLALVCGIYTLMHPGSPQESPSTTLTKTSRESARTGTNITSPTLLSPAVSNVADSSPSRVVPELSHDHQHSMDFSKVESSREEEVREESIHSKEVTTEDLKKRDWLGIHKLSIAEESDKGYPYIVLPSDTLNLSNLPDRGEHIRFDLFDGFSLSGSVLMGYEDDDRKSLGVLLQGNSKLNVDYDVQGIFQHGFILSEKDQLSYAITKKEDGKLEIKGIELGEVFPDETGLLPPESAEGEDKSDNHSEVGGVKKSMIQGSDGGESESNSPQGSDLPQGAPPVPPTNPAPLADTFKLHSRPGANHTIYLDFNGHVTTGTIWNSFYSAGNPINTPAYSFEGDASFTNNELARIQQIWARVAEDFISFDVNVTTEEPPLDRLVNSGTGDAQWGVRVPIGGSSSDWYGASAGGVAFVGSFNWSNDTPVYVFPAQLGGGAEKYVAECISHEVGHAVGLNHDGRTSPAEEYYQGHGSGDTGWAPIMGNPYHRNLTQWSRGEYVNANRSTENDLLVITSQNGFGYRPDDSGNTPLTATILTFSSNTASRSGVIETNTDVDVFGVTVPDGLVQIDAVPGFRVPNVDLNLELLNSTQTVIATSNPADLLTGSISQNVAAGTYYVRVSGSGKGTWSTGGYSNYGGIGSYHFNVVISAVPGTPTPTSTPTSTSTAVATATATASPTATPIPPLATSTPTRTATPVPPTATNTPLPPTATATRTPTATQTPVPPTATPTRTATNTPLSPTATPAGTATALPTSTQTPVPPTATPEMSATPEPSATATTNPTTTPSVTPSEQPSSSPTATVVPTATETAAATATVSPTTPAVTPPDECATGDCPADKKPTTKPKSVRLSRQGFAIVSLDAEAVAPDTIQDVVITQRPRNGSFVPVIRDSAVESRASGARRTWSYSIFDYKTKKLSPLTFNSQSNRYERTASDADADSHLADQGSAEALAASETLVAEFTVPSSGRLLLVPALYSATARRNSVNRDDSYGYSVYLNGELVHIQAPIPVRRIRTTIIGQAALRVTRNDVVSIVIDSVKTKLRPDLGVLPVRVMYALSTDLWSYQSNGPTVVNDLISFIAQSSRGEVSNVATVTFIAQGQQGQSSPKPSQYAELVDRVRQIARRALGS